MDISAVAAAFIAKAGTVTFASAAMAVARIPESMGAQRRVEVDPGSGQKRLNLT